MAVSGVTVTEVGVRHFSPNDEIVGSRGKRGRKALLLLSRLDPIIYFGPDPGYLTTRKSFWWISLRL